MAYRQKKKRIEMGASGEDLLVLWHFCCAPRLLCKIEKSKDYDFTIYSINLEMILLLGEDLITMMRDHEKLGHIVNCGHYNKLWRL